MNPLKLIVILSLLFYSCVNEKAENREFFTELSQDGRTYTVKASVATVPKNVKRSGTSSGSNAIEIKGDLAFLWSELEEKFNLDKVIVPRENDNTKAYYLKIFSESLPIANIVLEEDFFKFISEAYDVSFEHEDLTSKYTILHNEDNELLSAINLSFSVKVVGNEIYVSNITSKHFEKLLYDHFSIDSIKFQSKVGYSINDTLFINRNINQQLDQLGFRRNDSIISENVLFINVK